MPCRINRRRVWTHRIMLEAQEHEHNAFATLTYNNIHLPEDRSVDSVHLQLFIKRLRKWYAQKGNATFRYYACGEYGEQDQRPHYHLALFGLPACSYNHAFYNPEKSCCLQCKSLDDAWGKGRTSNNLLTPESSAYIAGYVTKKFIWYQDGVRPPFSRMSNRPGIGAGAMDDVASTLLEHDYKAPDVPTALTHGQKRWPLGRYLRRRLRTRIGLPAHAPKETMDQLADQMSGMLEKARAYAPKGQVLFTFKQEVINAGEGKRRTQAFWQKLRDQKRIKL